MTINVYTFEDADGVEQFFHTQNYQDAERYAIKDNLKIIDNEFELSDSSVAADYTPKRKSRKKTSMR